MEVKRPYLLYMNTERITRENHKLKKNLKTVYLMEFLIGTRMGSRDFIIISDRENL